MTDRLTVLPLHLFTEGRSGVLLGISVDVRSCSATALMSALPPKADIHSRDQDVCFGPLTDMAEIQSSKMVQPKSAQVPLTE
jgi:hypothetical protein